MLWLPKDLYKRRTPAGDLLIDNRDTFVGSHVYDAYVGYAMSQLRQMERVDHQGYMGPKRRRLVERFGYDCKNASHLTGESSPELESKPDAPTDEKKFVSRPAVEDAK